MDYDYTRYKNCKLYINKGKSNLVNIGNTCYFNAAVSSLSNCMGLTHYMLSTDFPTTNVFTRCYINLLIAIYEKNQTISPKSFYKNLSSKFEKNKQHDSYECMMTILDLLHSSLREKRLLSCLAKENTHLSNAVKEFNLHFKESYSIVTELFFGQYIQQVQCDCNLNSHSYTPFLGINLAITIETKSIERLLSNYFKSQIIEKNCEKCKTETNHTIKNRIIKFPKYLILTFKRFDNSSRKINTMVEYSDILNLTRYSVDNSRYLYGLKSVINHIGTTNRGHYNTFNKIGEKWIVIDNDTTNYIDDYVSANAYVLLYELI